MPRFKVKSPIKHDGDIVRDGEIEMSAKHAAAAVARGELEPVREAKTAKADGGKADSGKGEGKPDDSTKPAK